MRRISLRTKFLTIPVAIAVTLGIVVSALIHLSWSRQLSQELREKGASIGRNLSIRSIDYILIDDIVSLRQLLQEVTETEHDVHYAFILSPELEPLGHTFAGGFPEQLAEVNQLEAGQKQGMQLLDTGEELICDMATPILGGSLGSVHIGISEAHIRESVRSSVLTLIGITTLILTVGTAATVIFVNRTVKPIADMTSAAEAIGDGNLDLHVAASSNDEVGRLATTFNLMTGKLKQAREELHDVQEQLVQTGKLASVGQFTAGIAHEINNPLGGTLNCVRRLLSSPQIRGEERQYLELTLKGLGRIESIIRQLLTFSDQRKFDLGPTDIDEVIEESLALTEHRCREQKVKIEKRLAGSLPAVSADASQIQQVFMNVIKNALDAMPTGGRLNINSTCQAGEEERSGRSVNIEFADTGPGIKKKEIARIFEPFFTRKDVGKGVGLGLWVSYGIIQRHGGMISAHSKEGEGTTISIRLPVPEG